jgi:hypothetical protein
LDPNVGIGIMLKAKLHADSDCAMLLGAVFGVGDNT